MISIPGSLSFAKLVMMSSAPAKSAGDARYASQVPLIHGNLRCPIQSQLQSILGVRSFYVERNEISFHSHANKANFHRKNFALSLAFVMRFKAT